jgi:hypothetical protein
MSVLAADEYEYSGIYIIQYADIHHTLNKYYVIKYMETSLNHLQSASHPGHFMAGK